MGQTQIRLDTEALRVRGILNGPWRPTQFRSDEPAPDEMVDALVWALAEFAGEHDENRRSFSEAQHPRNPKGSPGGGRFKSIADRVVAALAEHHAGKGDGDPLKEFNREQVRKVAKARGIELKRGASEAEIKKALVDHAAPGKVKTAKKATKTATPAKAKANEHVGRVATTPKVISGAHADGWARGQFTAPDDLSKQHHDAVRQYSDAAFVVVNKILRGDTSGDNRQRERAQQFVADIDALLAKERMPEDVTVVRTLSSWPGGDPEAAVGTVIQDRAYLSTSVAARPAPGRTKANVQMKIDVPKGYPAYYLNGASAHPKEHELLLPRGTRLAVVSATKGPGGRWFIHAQVITE